MSAKTPTGLSSQAARFVHKRRETTPLGHKGRVMFFLLRTAFWLSIVLVLLPSGGHQAKSSAVSIGPADAVSAASAAVSDMSGFCDRQPEACEIGGQAAVAFGQRAQAGARFLFDYLNDRIAPGATGSVTQRSRMDEPPSQHTLTPGDMRLEWRAPLPPKDPRRAA